MNFLNNKELNDIIGGSRFYTPSYLISNLIYRYIRIRYLMKLVFTD